MGWWPAAREVLRSRQLVAGPDAAREGSQRLQAASQRVDEAVVQVVAPVPNNGTALTPNFVPLALWVGP